MNGGLHDGGGSQAEEFWEGYYRERERVCSGRANPVLVDVVGSLPPGAALDLGCGEGGDAIWLARQGWRVTAVDVSATALDRAAADAATAGVAERIDFRQHDLAVTFPSGAFDLVSAQYLHSPIEFPRERVLRAAAQAMAPGGLLLVVTHASVAPWSWAARTPASPPQRKPWPRSSWTRSSGAPNGWAHPSVGPPARTGSPPPSPTTSSRSDASRSNYPVRSPKTASTSMERTSAMSTNADAATPDPRRWLALVVIATATLMVVLDVSIVNIALPQAQTDLRIPEANRHWVITAYALAFGGLLLLGGRVADFVGRKRSFIIGIIGFALASILGGLAENAAILFGARTAGGVRAPAGRAVPDRGDLHRAARAGQGFRRVRRGAGRRRDRPHTTERIEPSTNRNISRPGENPPQTLDLLHDRP